MTIIIIVIIDTIMPWSLAINELWKKNSLDFHRLRTDVYVVFRKWPGQ